MKLRSCMTRCCVNRCDCNPRQSRMQFSARLTVTRRAGVFHLGHLPRRIRRYTGHTRISTDNIMRNMPAAMRFMLTLTFCFPAILHACMARTSTPNHRHTETHQLMLVWDRDAPSHPSRRAGTERLAIPAASQQPAQQRVADQARSARLTLTPTLALTHECGRLSLELAKICGPAHAIQYI